MTRRRQRRRWRKRTSPVWKFTNPGAGGDQRGPVWNPERAHVARNLLPARLAGVPSGESRHPQYSLRDSRLHIGPTQLNVVEVGNPVYESARLITSEKAPFTRPNGLIRGARGVYCIRRMRSSTRDERKRPGVIRARVLAINLLERASLIRHGGKNATMNLSLGIATSCGTFRCREGFARDRVRL